MPGNEKILRPIHPNLGLELAYRRCLYAIIEEMHDSTVYWLQASYRQNKPRIAMDESPADALRRAIKRLARRWFRRFDIMAVQLAEYFARSIASRTSGQLKKILKDGGWTVEFKMTAAMRDVVDAAVHANVQLIKSIPQQYLGQVEQIVMQSVQAGRDLEHVSEALQGRLGVTKRRAALIARDQNNKATAALCRARQIEAGIEQAIWVHSGAGKEPRPSHIRAGRDKVRYDVRDGWFDPHERKHILPGELINCRCIGRAVVPGFS